MTIFVARLPNPMHGLHLGQRIERICTRYAFRKATGAGSLPALGMTWMVHEHSGDSVQVLENRRRRTEKVCTQFPDETTTLRKSGIPSGEKG